MIKDIIDIILITTSAGITGYLICGAIKEHKKAKSEEILNECKELCKSIKEQCNDILTELDSMHRQINRIAVRTMTEKSEKNAIHED